jgi:hypothetical protein
MQMPGADRPDWLRGTLLALLVLMHLLALQGLNGHRQSPAQPAAGKALIQISLLPARVPARQVRLPAQPRHSALRRSAAATALTPAVNPEMPNPDSQDRQAATTPDKASESTGPAPVKPLAQRLNLALPGKPASGAQPAPAQWAAMDPRANSHRPDFGERMAAAIGSDPTLREEIINPGHRRIRQGSRCLDLKDTRNSQINPFDETARMGPKLMSACK